MVREKFKGFLHLEKSQKSQRTFDKELDDLLYEYITVTYILKSFGRLVNIRM